MGFGFGGKILAFIANAITIGYWVFVAVVMGSVFFAFKGKAPIWGRVIVALMIGGILMSWPIINHLKESQTKKEANTRYQAADAHFQECCKKAGVKIHRTVENVEGIMLMKLRPKWNLYDQDAEDPYGHDCSGDECIRDLLSVRYQYGEYSNKKQAVHPGYRYVDVIEADGKHYRYTGYMGLLPDRPGRTEPVFMLKKALSKGPAPRYGVTYDDIATPEERAMWIAASSLKIIDLKTNEVIAERIGYAFDRGMGNNSGGRSPWGHALENACPPLPNGKIDGRTRLFTEQVLKLKER